jgi:glycosidase
VSRSASSVVLLALAALALTGCGGPPEAPHGGVFGSAPRASGLATQRIYFVMTDRYANGDPADDRGGKVGGPEITGYDPTSTAYFHGGDFKGLTANLDRIKQLGFTSIWITPPFGQNTVQGTSAAYHGYWIDDFLHVDPHLGTDADFGAFVHHAHALGLKVILDVVVNHTGDVIQLSKQAYQSRPYRDCHGKVFDPAKYVGGTTFPCLSAKMMPNPPTVEPAIKSPAWLNDPTNYHDRGDLSFNGPCDEQCLEQGDFFGLDDLFTEKPVVVNGLAAVYAGWVKKYKLDGFRVDTARYVNAGFFSIWVPKILAAARSVGVRDFQIFGEDTTTDPLQLSTIVRDDGLPNVLDFPFQDTAVHFTAGQVDATQLAKLLADDDYFRTAADVVPSPATFLGNHDIGRAAYQVAQAGVGTGFDLLSRVFFAYDLLYLLRGTPVVYYGDEVGMLGTGGDQAAREDMFPTKVADWQTEQRVGWPPIGKKSSLTITEHPLEKHIAELSALRAKDPALDGGWTIVRYAQGPLLIVSRIDPASRRETVVGLNAGGVPTTVSVHTATPASDWSPLRGDIGGHSSGTGRLPVRVDPLVATVLEAKRQVQVSAPPTPQLNVAADPQSNLWAVHAAVATTTEPLSVAFGVYLNGRWTLLANDPEPPYRAFLDPARFKDGEKVSLVAVARSLDGRTAASKVLRYTVRSR